MARSKTSALLPIIAAAVVLIAPIVLWAVFGNGDPQHTFGVAVGSAILAWAVARRAEDRDAATKPSAPRPRPQPSAQDGGCRMQPVRPAAAFRLQRDVRCEAARRELAPRPVRRRARP